MRYVKQRGWLDFDFLTFRRGAYCAMTIISLLDLPLTLADGQARDAGLETLTSGLPQYLSRCESGIRLVVTCANYRRPDI